MSQTIQSPRALLLLTALAFIVAALGLASACGGGAVRAAATPAPPTRPTLVAQVHVQDPGQALQQYLRGWIRRFNKAAWADTAAAQNDSIITADSVSVVPNASATQAHAIFRADFRFSVGVAWSSVHPVWTRHSSATYDLSWDGQGRVWTVRLTSSPPDETLSR